MKQLETHNDIMIPLILIYCITFIALSIQMNSVNECVYIYKDYIIIIVIIMST
jgi:hypothetical protein